MKLAGSGLSVANVARTFLSANGPKNSMKTNTTTTTTTTRHRPLAGGVGGSGFVVHEDGIVVTNYHVMEEGIKSSVVFANDEEYMVQGILALDGLRDVAVLQIDTRGKKLPVVKLANKLPRKGEKIVNFGTPLGLDFTTSNGIISAIRSQEQMAEVAGITNLRGNWIQTDAAISSGSSGGPMVNMYGEVVAANTMQRLDGQSLNFGISSIDINNVVAKRTKTPKELGKGVVPLFRKQFASPGGTGLVDAAGTKRGNMLLAEMKEITFVVAANAIDPTGRIAFFVRAKAEGAVDKLELEIGNSNERSFMLIVMILEDAGRKTTAGTQKMTLYGRVWIKDQDKRGKTQLVKIWSKKDEIGTVAIPALVQGKVPRTMESNVGKFFRRFQADIRKARTGKLEITKDQETAATDKDVTVGGKGEEKKE